MPTSARWEPANSPQIFVKTVRTARVDVGIGPYKHVRKTNRADSVARPYRLPCRISRAAAHLILWDDLLFRTARYNIKLEEYRKVHDKGHGPCPADIRGTLFAEHNHRR